MARKFSELEAKMSPESRARSAAKAKQMLAEIEEAEASARLAANGLPVDQPTDEDLREPNRAPIWNGREEKE